MLLLPSHTECHLGCDRCTFGMIAPLSTILQLALSSSFCRDPLVILREGSEHSDAVADFPTDSDEEFRERGIAF